MRRIIPVIVVVSVASLAWAVLSALRDDDEKAAPTVTSSATVTTHPSTTISPPAPSDTPVFAFYYPKTWEGIRLDDGMLERCPHCHRSSRFAKGDYLFRQTDE